MLELVLLPELGELIAPQEEDELPIALLALRSVVFEPAAAEYSLSDSLPSPFLSRRGKSFSCAVPRASSREMKLSWFLSTLLNIASPELLDALAEEPVLPLLEDALGADVNERGEGLVSLDRVLGVVLAPEGDAILELPLVCAWIGAAKAAVTANASKVFRNIVFSSDG